SRHRADVGVNGESHGDFLLGIEPLLRPGPEAPALGMARGAPCTIIVGRKSRPPKLSCKF
ncbi:hypothetical protein, partial [Sphingomonas elodea]|uniref:hypothetical protein n=1 Tax=Sphingomonas elodea TaxID=179878 RepID=UPI001ED95E3F